MPRSTSPRAAPSDRAREAAPAVRSTSAGAGLGGRRPPGVSSAGAALVRSNSAGAGAAAAPCAVSSDAVPETVAPAGRDSAGAGPGATTSPRTTSRAVAPPGALSPDPASPTAAQLGRRRLGGDAATARHTRRQVPSRRATARAVIGQRRGQARWPAPTRRSADSGGDDATARTPDAGSRAAAPPRATSPDPASGAALRRRSNPTGAIPAPAAPVLRRLVRHARGRAPSALRATSPGDSPTGAEPPAGSSPFMAGTGRLPTAPAGPTTRGPRVVARSRRSGSCGVERAARARRHPHPAVGRSGSPRHRSSGRPRSPDLDASGPGRR